VASSQESEDGHRLDERLRDEWKPELVIRSAQLLFVGAALLVPYVLATMRPPLVTTVALLATLVASAVAAILPRISTHTRAIVLVGGLLGLGAAGTYTHGPSPGILLALTTTVVFSSVFLETRGAVLVLALTAVVFAVFGTAGRFDSVPRVAADHLLLGSWARMTASYTLLSALILLMISSAVRRAEHQLAKTRSALEEALRERRARSATEKALREEEARLRQALEAGRLGSLVAGVAHEVRTPLFNISATIDAFEGESREELEEVGRVLHAEVTRLNDLMSDLLDYGRPAALPLEPGSVREPLDRALQACDALALSAQVTIVTTVPDGLPLVRRNGRLEQAFQNLIANAVQHSRPGSTVRVTVRAARDGGSEALDCSVEDEGPGIPENDLPHVFEPFFTKRKGGTGLGLSIVQRIVEEHGGRVTAANRTQGGAAFTIRLPSYETALRAPETQLTATLDPRR
jgi:signal transduction histidine kinase